MASKPVELTKKEIAMIIYEELREQPHLTDEQILHIKEQLETFRKIVPKYYLSPFVSIDTEEGLEHFDSVYNQAVDSVQAYIKYGDPIQQSGRKAPKRKTKTTTVKKTSSPAKAKGHRAKKNKTQRKK